MDGVKTELEARGNEPELSISSLPYFNRQIWGLKKGLTILAGRTSMGKSALALQMAYDLADQQKEVLFLSLEMTVESLIERLFCNRMEVDNYDMLTGKMKINVEYQEKWGTFVKLMDIPLKLSCGLGKTFDDINGLIELLEPKPKVIIVDYIQAIRKTSNERLDMDDYIIRFREICLLHNIAGVLISQNSRKVFEEETKEPTLANLKGCIHPNSIVKGKTIKEIVDKKLDIEIITYDIENKKIKKIKPTSYVHSGKRRCLKIRTKSGKEIILSRGTKLYDGRVWREAKTFLIGQKILVDFSGNT